MERKIRAQRNVSENNDKDLKRPRPKDEIEETILVEDDDEGSQSNSIMDGAAVQVGSSKVSLVFASQEFKSRNYELKTDTRTVLLPKI